MRGLGIWRRIAALIAGAIALTGAGAHAQPPARAPLTVFAAASLTDALQAVARAYTARTRVPVRFSFASSAQVARQVEAGAAADLVFSADAAWMDHMQAAGAIVGPTRRDLLRGRLALVAPADSRTTLRIAPGMPIARALGPQGRLATGDPAYVPAGRYAEAALRALRVWDTVSARLVRADNVRTALAYVARGEAPLGIVYETDALGEPRVRIVALFPEATHPPIVYPVAIARTAAPHALGFYDFVRGREAQTIFARFGFRAAR